MTTSGSTFAGWAATQLRCDVDDLTAIRLGDAFTVLVCRVEDAARRNADDPLSVVRNSTAGGNSRAATRRMLGHLGYTPAQLRVVHRLLGGSPGGWPGLLGLYVARTGLTSAERTYARRQVRLISGSGLAQERRDAIAS